MPTIPPVTALHRDETFGGHSFASRAGRAARQVVAMVGVAAGTLVELLSSAARGGSPSSPRAGLRSAMPALVPVPVPLHTARRQARLAGHPAGHCRQW